MRDPSRIKRILQLVEIIWESSPDLRLTQVIMNALNMNSDPYYVEDKLLEESLLKYIRENL